MSYPKDRLLDERPDKVTVRFDGDHEVLSHPDCGVTYTEDPTERDGWRVEIEGEIWLSLIVGEDLKKGTAGMVELQLLKDYDDPDDTEKKVGDRQFAELTWPAVS